MKKSQLISYSMVLLLSGLMFGCTTSDRVDEIASNINNPQSPNNGGNFINDENSTDENNTVGIIKIDAKNAYKVSATFSDEYNQKGYYSREEVGSINFNIKNIYSPNESIDISKIESITLEAEEKESDVQGKYFNFITFDGKEGPTYKIPSSAVKSNDNVALKIKNLSGTTNLILSVNLKDFDKPYILKVPLIIEKNKSSSMAIVPIGSRYENGLFIDKFVIHVADSYGNKAKDGTSISAGVINNPKLYSNAFNNIAYNKEDELTLFNIIRNPKSQPFFYNDIGTLNKNNDLFTLPANSIDTTKDTITTLDTLVLLANKDQHKPENLGGWDITSINNSSEIALNNYNKGDNVSNISYAIGDEYRYDECSQTLMNAAASTFETTEVKDGIAYAELRYVPAMVGKTVFIYANSQLENKHIGISRKVTLKGLGLATQTLSCDYKITGADCSISFKMLLNGPEKTPAQNVYIEQPLLSGPAVYNYATASRTDCDGWTTVTIHGIDINKTATVKFGEYIADELIINQK